MPETTKASPVLSMETSILPPKEIDVIGTTHQIHGLMLGIPPIKLFIDDFMVMNGGEFV